MKKWFVLPVALFSFSAFGQASIAYYPWQDYFLTVSTNPTRAVWLDFRLQTNTLLGQFNTAVVPLINVKRAPTYQIYLGPGVEFSAVNAALGNEFLQNASFHVGTRISPFAVAPNFQVAFELAPTVNVNNESGVLRSRLGFAYIFRKRKTAAVNP
ncbi:hypothetical protein [Larkinella soli]|uniref:hypothetical protein n=1 Tax=Larkinella soli TaxID=1770527 RepID=UPI000FFC1713|nr:hypothetical protein [Larkinella soli]